MLQGVPPPDFPGGAGESQFADRANPIDIQSAQGKLAMGFSPFPVKEGSVQGELAKRANFMLGYI